MLIILVFGSFLISIYTDNSEVAMMALILLYYAIIFQIPDAVGFSAVGSLRATKTHLVQWLI